MQYERNKYTVIEYVVDGIYLSDRVLVGDNHDAEVETKIDEIFAQSGATGYTLSTRYIYDPIASEVV